MRKGHLTSIAFHSDMTYERQPPGLTMFTLLSVPPTGGDTVWTSQAAAYARLSQPIKTLLEGLRAEHSGHPQADGARRRGKLCTEGACYFAASCYSGPLGMPSRLLNGFIKSIRPPLTV